MGRIVFSFREISTEYDAVPAVNFGKLLKLLDTFPTGAGKGVDANKTLDTV
ncbi:unnamed protein product, partial [marine sediment metagenome]